MRAVDQWQANKCPRMAGVHLGGVWESQVPLHYAVNYTQPVAATACGG